MDDYEFQVGDIVRILSKGEHNGDVYFGWDDEMETWAYQCFVISEINKPFNDTYIYFENMPERMKLYSWGTDMIELITSVNDIKISEEENKKEWNNFFNDV